MGTTPDRPPIDASRSIVVTEQASRSRAFARGAFWAVSCAIVLAVWQPGDRPQLGAALEGNLLDLRFRMRGALPPPGTVAIVAFDDRAVNELHAFPPSRLDIAETVHAIFDAGATVVALDLLLVDPRADDPAVARALRRGATVLGVAEAPAGTAPTPLVDPGGFGLVVGADPLLPLPAMGPHPGLQAHASLGHVTVQHDADGSLRRMRPALTLRTRDGTRTLPALAVAAASARGARPEIVLPGSGSTPRLAGDWPIATLDRRGSLPLNFKGPGGTITTFSAADLSTADLAGRIVFLGATATGFGDRHATSFDATLPGVEAHATLAANLLDGGTLRRDMAAWRLDAVLGLALAVAGFWAGGLPRPGLAIPAGATVLLAAILALQVAFTRGWWLDATTVLAALSAGLAIGGTQRVLDTRRRAANLARFQSPRLIDAVASQTHPLGGGVSHEAVVVFVDVAGFTTFAESKTPAEAARFLREFHELVEAAAEPWGGTIMDYAGDGVLVAFGLPHPAADDASRALRFIDNLFKKAADRDIVLRMGSHVGQVQLSLLGGVRHRTISISGDVVNTASRLQDAATRLDAELVVSEAFVNAVGDGERRRLEPVGETLVRGRSAPVAVWMRPIRTRAGRQP